MTAPSSPERARQALRDALAGGTYPATVTTPYGETVDVGRALTWLEQADQPTLYALAAVLTVPRHRAT